MEECEELKIESPPTQKFFAFTDLVLGKFINKIKQLNKL